MTLKILNFTIYFLFLFRLAYASCFTYLDIYLDTYLENSNLKAEHFHISFLKN